jgi:hypothetical protein
MSCLLFADDNDNVRKVNIDDLYEKKKKQDMKQLSIFNKILNRINKRIEITGRTKRNERFIWFVVPEFIFGESVYNQSDCIAYVVTKLTENGFFVKYLHPNTLYVSWEHWVPTYVRQELKKRTGYIIDEKGNVLDKVDKKGESELNIASSSQNPASNTPQKEQKQYKQISDYKPTGNLVYGKDQLEKIEKRVSFL